MVTMNQKVKEMKHQKNRVGIWDLNNIMLAYRLFAAPQQYQN